MTRTLLILCVVGLIEGGTFYLVADAWRERGYQQGYVDGVNQGYPEGVRWALINARGLPTPATLADFSNGRR